MSRANDIAAFVKVAQGGLTMETLARAIRHRWPDAEEAEVRHALMIASGDGAQAQAMACQPQDD